MEQKKRKTEVKSIAINGYLLDRANKLVDAGKFGTVSDVVVTALTEFLERYDIAQGNNNVVDTTATDIIVQLLQTEGGKAAIDGVLIAHRGEENKSPETPISFKRKLVIE